MRQEAALLEIIRHHFGARGEAGLDPRLGLEPFLARLLREETRADHHRWVRGVRAARDRRDYHRAVSESGAAAVQLHGDGLVRRAAFHHRRESFLKRVFRLRERDPVLRPFRPRDARLDGGEIQLQRVGEDRIGNCVGAEKPLLFAVGLDQLDELRRPAGEFEILERLRVRRKVTDGRAVLRRHIADGGSVRDAEAR